MKGGLESVDSRIKGCGRVHLWIWSWVPIVELINILQEEDGITVEGLGRSYIQLCRTSAWDCSI